MAALSASVLFLGDTWCAADEAPAALLQQSNQAPVDRESEAMLLKVEQQISAGHAVLPPDDNALATWESVLARAMPASPGTVLALRIFAARATNDAAREQSAGRLSVARDFRSFEALATQLIKQVHDEAVAAIPSAAPSKAVPENPTSPEGRASATGIADGSTASVEILPVTPTVGGMSEQVAAATGKTTLVVTAPAVPPPPNNPKMTRDAALATSYARRGDEMLAIKDISAARKYYESAANAGDANAAMALASTFDPAYLTRLGVVGLRPNPALAANWYRVAVELGSPVAAARLRALAPDGTR